MFFFKLAAALKDRLFKAKRTNTAVKPHAHSDEINRALQQSKQVFYLNFE